MTGNWVLAACAAACMAVSCKNDLDRVAAMDLGGEVPDRITTAAEYVYSDSGVVRNRIRAGTIMEYGAPRPRTVVGDGVELTFFGPDGKAGSHLNAGRGEILPEARLMSVMDRVVFTNARGEQLETEKLTWMQDSGKVYTDLPVKITRAHDIIYGQGLDAAEDFSSYVVRKVTGSLFLDRNDTLAPGNANK